jgi:hypothetical protein
MAGRENTKLRNAEIEKCRIRVGKIIDSKIIFGIMKDGLG